MPSKNTALVWLQAASDMDDRGNTLRASSRISCLILILLSFSAMAGQRTVTYYYTDPLGTPLAEADDSGNIVRVIDQRPYGANVLGHEGQDGDAIGYTGHVVDDDSGLVYMQARYYDPLIGRFMSEDPQASSVAAGSLFFFNRFAYANNSPMRFTDAHGDKPGDHFSTPEKAALDALQYINGRSISENREYQGYITVLGQGDYVATDAVMLSIDGGSTEGTPPGAVGDYHTHGHWTMGTRDNPVLTDDPSKDTFGSAHFSVDDIRRYLGIAKELQHQYRGYLATPGGSYFFFDATTQSRGDLKKAVEEQERIEKAQREFEARQRMSEFTGQTP
jgi:RHS repeat-associated protein